MRTIYTLILFLFLFHTAALGQFDARKVLVDYSFKSSPNTLAVGDLNNDNRPDLVVTSDQYSASASYFISNANGTFTEIPLAGSAKQGNISVIEVMDLDGNGYKDIVALTKNSYTYGTNRVMVWYNDNGSLAGSPQILIDNLAESGYTHNLHFYDMNRDGKTDIVLSGLHPSYKVVWLQNRGRYSSWPVNQVDQIDAIQHILVADLDADGSPEIVNGWNIFTGPNFSTKKSFERDDMPMTAADMDRDGDLDIVAGPYDISNTLAWYENKGNLEFQKHEIPGISGYFRSVLVQDFNDDGLPDIAVGCPTTCSMSFLRNEGKGVFTVSSITTSTPGIINQGAMRAADMDFDGKLDLVTTDYAWRVVGFYKNNMPVFEGIQADFRAEVTPCTLTGVEFTDMSLGQNIIAWNWSFGDGATATSKNATHAYAAPGQYTVTLQVRKNDGTSSSFSKTLTITSPPTIEDKFEIWYCEGSTPFTLTIPPAEQGMTYKWYGDMSSASPLTYTGNTFQLSRYEMTIYVEKINQAGCASKRVPVYIRQYLTPKPPLVEDATSFKGPATLRLEARDSDGRNDITFSWYEANPTMHMGAKPVYVGPVYERHFSKTQPLYVQAVSNAGCQSLSMTRVTAYVHEKAPVIPHFAWVKAGGSTSWSNTVGIAGDTTGTLLTVGDYAGPATVTMDQTTIALAPANKQNRNFYLFKQDAAGRVLGSSRILSLVNDSGSLSLQGVYTDADNNIYLTGKLSGTVEIAEKSTWTANGYFVIKLNPAGEVLWHKRVASEDGDSYGWSSYQVGIQVARDGTITCDLLLKGSAIFEGQQLGSPYYRYYPTDTYWTRYVLQYSAEGTLTSIREVGSMDYFVRKTTYPYDDYFVGPSFTASDEANALYQTGAFKSRTWVGTETLHGSYADTVFTTVLIKYGTDGKKIWHKTIASGSFGATPRKVLYHNKSIYVLGTTTVKNNATTRIGNTFTTFIDNAQVFLARFDTDGNLIWVKAIEGKQAAAVDAYDLLLDKLGDPYIIGASTGPTSFDGLMLQPPTTPGSPFSYVVKYTAQGELSWAKAIGNVTSYSQKQVYRLHGAFDSENQLVIHSNYHKTIILDDFVLPQGTATTLSSSLYTAKIGYKLTAAMQVEQTCPGQPVSFQDLSQHTPTEEVISREWNFGDGTSSKSAQISHTYNKPGQYLITLSIQGSKGNTSSIQQTITVKEAPLATISANGLQLTASEGESYRWFRNDSLMLESSNMLVVSESGKYKVGVSVEGCEIMSEEVQITVADTEGEVTAFPNPASTAFTLESKEHKMLGYSIYNTNGHLMMQQKLTAVLTQIIDVRKLLTGLYIMQIELENGTYVSYKFLKN
ncbi:VCBS repeat-containing protein [Pontibacter sp. Tf4]|nr:FG-GAP-like repeat-containing protein [Pontibacter sp. Tf4]MBB6613143.1 VCBS repeat-containing protein [Pontibacter sp. Tf4]